MFKLMFTWHFMFVAVFRLHGRDDYEMKVVFVTKGSKYNVINLNVKGSRTIGEVIVSL